MSSFELQAENVSKVFGRRLIFKDVNFSCKNNGIYGISGPNGSGKSTFLKIITGIISPTKGKVTHYFDGKIIESEDLHNYIGFVAPYVILYDEFTAVENIHFFSKIRGINFTQEKLDFLFQHFGIFDRKNDLVKGYSSGMKQRLKFIFALIHSPKILFFDEPTSNLDNSGKEKVYQTVKEESQNNIVIIASNEDSDLAICSSVLELQDYKKTNN
ncbi:MAG: ABC transporter ATP-binding protein [Ignavibacteriaceae bacterium]|jgi:heme exporter protein A